MSYIYVGKEQKLVRRDLLGKTTRSLLIARSIITIAWITIVLISTCLRFLVDKRSNLISCQSTNKILILILKFYWWKSYTSFIMYILKKWICQMTSIYVGYCNIWLHNFRSRVYSFSFLLTQTEAEIYAVYAYLLSIVCYLLICSSFSGV